MNETLTMRIIEDEDARRFYCDATLYDFDILDKHLDEKVMLDFTNPVPVYSANRPGIPVGYANAYINGNRLDAEIFMDYSTPERLDIDVGEDVIALPGGDFSMSYRVGRVDAIWLPHITLSRQHEDGVGGICLPVAPPFSRERGLEINMEEFLKP